MPKLTKSERGWLFWLQRVSFLVIPAATGLLLAASFTLDIFFDINNSINTILWSGLIIYAMPLPPAVLVMAWTNPYAGSIAALISIPLITIYYLALSAIFDSIAGSYLGTLQELQVFYWPEIILLVSGAILGFAWKRKWRKSLSFIGEIRELNPFVH